MTEQPEILTEELAETLLENDIGFEATVILFNDEEHTFDEVIEQLIKAINCSYDKAAQLTNEVHSSGKAAVFTGDLFNCLNVSSVLEEIALHTQIEC